MGTLHTPARPGKGLWLRQAELAKYLGRSVYLVRKWDRDGSLPKPKISGDGGAAMWLVADIDRWLGGDGS